MPDERPADPLAGKKLLFKWTDGPTKGATHEHVFNADGSVDYRKVTAEAQKDKPTHEKKYGAAKVTTTACGLISRVGLDSRSRSCSTMPTIRLGFTSKQAGVPGERHVRRAE